MKVFCLLVGALCMISRCW